MATKKLLELAESTSPDDSDILMIEDTVATKRITFLNLFNKVKAKLALATVATSGKASDLSGLATVATSGKLADTAKDADNRTITDAERAKWNEYGTDITSLNSNLSQGGVDNDVGYSKFPDGTYIQWGFFGGTAMTNSNKNATRQVTFRENFAGTAPVSVLITPANANYLNGYCVDNIAATGCRVILMGALAANTTYDSGFRWLAIGRWK